MFPCYYYCPAKSQQNQLLEDGDDIWHDKPDDLKKIAKEYSQKLYSLESEPIPELPKLEFLNYPTETFKP